MRYTIDEFKEIMFINDITFKYNGKSYYIFQGTNSCIVGEDGNDKKEIVFNKYKNVSDNIDDTLNNWIIDEKPLKTIISEIKLDF